MTTDRTSPRIDVAVAVVRDAAGRVLVNQRPSGKPFAGRWEFPGGKMADGETAAQALIRELDEELGIAVRRQRPLITFPYRYDDFTVRLHVNEVLDYHGAPSGREGQVLDWVQPQVLDRIDLLAANAAIVRAVVLPRICLITDTARFGAAQTLERLEGHLEDRRVLLIVREKEMRRRPLSRFVRQATDMVRERGSLVVVHADCDFDDYASVDGMHLSASSLAPDATPDRTRRVGVSCHSAAELQLAAELGADYALLSPVKQTTSHPKVKPLGWTAFEGLCEPAPLPVYALGGLAFADLETAIGYGAQGIALLGAAWRNGA